MMRAVIVLALSIGVMLAIACGGGGSKPPMVPDDPNTPTPVLVEGGANEDAGW